jgi:hypothetical protein
MSVAPMPTPRPSQSRVRWAAASSLAALVTVAGVAGAPSTGAVGARPSAPPAPATPESGDGAGSRADRPSRDRPRTITHRTAPSTPPAPPARIRRPVARPAKPTKPAEPKKPVEPEQPVRPERPVQPARPAAEPAPTRPQTDTPPAALASTAPLTSRQTEVLRVEAAAHAERLTRGVRRDEARAERRAEQRREARRLREEERRIERAAHRRSVRERARAARQAERAEALRVERLDAPGAGCPDLEAASVAQLVADIFRCRLRAAGYDEPEVRRVTAEAVTVAQCESLLQPHVVVFDGRYVATRHPRTGYFYTAAGVFQFIRDTADRWIDGGYAHVFDANRNIDAAARLYLANRALGLGGWEDWACAAANDGFQSHSVLPGYPGGPEQLPDWAWDH